MKPSTYRCIIILAYANRYLYPILLLVSLGFENGLISGSACFIFAAYELVGYLCKWKHIFCSYQNAYHKKMTPDKINWRSVRKSDAYGVPAIFGILGAALIVFYIVSI